MFKVFLRNILGICILTCSDATIIFKNLSNIARLFESERVSYQWHDIVLFGDFNINQVEADFVNSFQVAVHSEKANSTTGAEIMINILKSEHNNSVLFFYAPASVEDLYEIINTISESSSTENITDKALFQRFLFILWPAAQDPFHIRNKLQTDPNVLNSVQFISLIEHVYILTWTLDADEMVLTGTIELYGILDSVAVVQFAANMDEDSCNSTVDINTTELLRIAIRRNDFHGLVFNVVAENDSYYEAEVSVKAFDNGTIYFPSGSSLNILLDLMMSLNFRYEPILGSGWSEPGVNGTSITGLGLQVMEHEADICISTSSMEEYMSKYITFLQPIMNEESFVFFRQPSVTAARNIFMMPFNSVLWHYTFTVWGFIMICALVMALPKPGVIGHVGTCRMYTRLRPRRESFHWYDAYIWTIGIACQQGWFGSPVQVSVRILFISGLLTNLVLFSYYTAAFVAAISAPIIPIQTFNDLDRYHYVIFANPSNPGFIASFAQEKQMKEILAVSETVFETDDNAVSKVMTPNSKYATIIGLDGFYSVGLGAYNDTELCKIDRLKGGSAAKIKDAMFLRKGSPYKEMMGHITVKLIERGLANRNRIAYQINTELRCLKNPVQTVELDILDCYTAFLILLVAHVLAFCTALCERHRSLLSHQTPSYFLTQPPNLKSRFILLLYNKLF